MELPVPFSRCYWVAEGRLLAGCYPGDADAHSADVKLRGLVSAGIGTVISLMESDEVSWGGKPFRPYAERIVALGKESGIDITCLRFPIRDTHIPTHEEMEAILEAIEVGLSRGVGVYVHCWGGKGRTGTVVGCHLIRNGLATPENFVDVIRQRRGPDAATGSSPENAQQIRFVREFGTN